MKYLKGLTTKQLYNFQSRTIKKANDNLENYFLFFLFIIIIIFII